MILKIVIIAIICIFLSSTLKQYNSEFSNIISVCGGILIFFIVCDEVANILEYLLTLYESLNFNLEIYKLLIKILGIGYVCEFMADIAEDFGNKIIASKVLLGGKIIICGMTIPVIKDLLSMLLLFLSY